MRTMTIDTPLGLLTAGAVESGICMLAFPRRVDEERRRVERRVAAADVPGADSHLALLRAELAAYFEGRLRAFTVRTVTGGTPFQERVWSALRDIPYGVTWSYEALAARIGAAGAQRAVGHANGSNPIAIVIPCHRVINKSGKLGGYGGELWRKEVLLRLESGRPTLDFGA
jgi:AraC family transcriptional regulator of adaptative response/methylated-DNA-[protein]-cysteine methyltransferase